MDLPASGPADQLVGTKVLSPLLRPEVIVRGRLLETLRGALTSRRLTLVSAPAGYGKTTPLGALPHACPDLPIIWLSLDEGDSDPARFLAGLVAALRRLNGACGANTRNLLSGLASPGAEVRRVVGVLINDILETLTDPFALILDDLHLVTEPSVYAALDYLLERLPPQMHLVVATRHDPPLSLARMRARGQLAELRLADLRFTLDEADLLLNGRLSLGLSHDDLVALQARAEGWPAGLGLLAGSLGRISAGHDRAAFIRRLARTDRYVFDFLAEEVWNRIDPKAQAFLLQTSILDELTPALCQAVADATMQAAS